MTNGNLAEVGARLEKAVMALPGEPADCDELYEQFEYIAIQMLDSEHAEYSDGALEAYLHGYLAGWSCGLRRGTPPG